MKMMMKLYLFGCVALIVVSARFVFAQPQQQSGPSTVAPEDVACEVCDSAVSFYVRSALATNLYCLGYSSNVSSTMQFVAMANAGFQEPSLNPEFCKGGKVRTPPEAPAKKQQPSSPGQTQEAEKKAAKAAEEDDDDIVALEDVPSAASSYDQGAAAAAAAAAADVVPDDLDNRKQQEEKYLALDDTLLVEMARRAWICKNMLTHFPAVEIFPAEGREPVDIHNMKDEEKPQAAEPRFISVLQRACDITVGNPKQTAKLIEQTKRALTVFPYTDPSAPKLEATARNYIWKHLTREVQEGVCTAGPHAPICHKGMVRHKNFVPLTAFSVYGKPIVQ